MTWLLIAAVWLVAVVVTWSICKSGGDADRRIAAMHLEASRLGPRPVRGEAPQPATAGSADPAGNTPHIVHSSVHQPSVDAQRVGPAAPETAGPPNPRSIGGRGGDWGNESTSMRPTETPRRVP